MLLLRWVGAAAGRILGRPAYTRIISVSGAAASTPRHISSTPAARYAKPFPPRPSPPPENEIEETFLKGSGPGGQKINKTNSAVQLRHIPTGVVVKCQSSRSREQNRRAARRLLAERLDELRNGTGPDGTSRTSIVAAIKKKRRASSDKKSRRKYRALAAAKAAAEAEAETDATASEAAREMDDAPDAAYGSERTGDGLHHTADQSTESSTKH